jgi:hypothetical protein
VQPQPRLAARFALPNVSSSASLSLTSLTQFRARHGPTSAARVNPVKLAAARTSRPLHSANHARSVSFDIASTSSAMRFPLLDEGRTLGESHAR